MQETLYEGRWATTGLQEFEVSDVQIVKEYIEKGDAARSTGSTDANEESSRSHAILQLAVKKHNEVKDSRRNNDENDSKSGKVIGKISFIDLAGSERGADTTDNDKQTSHGDFYSCEVLHLNLNLIPPLLDFVAEVLIVSAGMVLPMMKEPSSAPTLAASAKAEDASEQAQESEVSRRAKDRESTSYNPSNELGRQTSSFASNHAFPGREESGANSGGLGRDEFEVKNIYGGQKMYSRPYLQSSADTEDKVQKVSPPRRKVSRDEKPEKPERPGNGSRKRFFKLRINVMLQTTKKYKYL
ncbi:kinesin-13a [Nicotiana attenuata]|uniref:Kinesin-like protein n=1 Tax=Nicotiana attenuata TaxID=49451 RepID=A0A314KNT6_NICAT|nr:kinesin-13a [Nicotiana attenuata]